MKREFIPMSGLYDMNIGALRMYYAQRPTPKPENEVKDTPSGYNDWLNENEDRILDAAKRGKLPYWIKENKKYVNVLQKQGG